MSKRKYKRTVCRSRKSGRFSGKGKCGAYKRERVSSGWMLF